MILPITPAEAENKIGSGIPDRIIACFNKLIAEKFDGRQAKFTQDDIIDRIRTETGLSRIDVGENNWLDVEPLFRKAGWKVEYNKPDYYEKRPAIFTFTK